MRIRHHLLPFKSSKAVPVGQDSWQEFCTEEYSVEKLDKNATIQGTCYWHVPSVPSEGYVLETAFCPDRDDIIWEEDETENRDKISDPIDDDLQSFSDG